MFKNFSNFKIQNYLQNILAYFYGTNNDEGFEMLLTAFKIDKKM